jgi:hypothetical protein
MRRTATWIALIGLALIVVGCGGGETGYDSTEQTSMKDAGDVPEVVQKAITIAQEIEGDPDNAEAILEKHGITEEGFEDLMYQIAQDPELSRSYNEALR